MSLGIIFNSIWNNPGNRGQRLRRLCQAVGWQFDKRVFKERRVIKLPNGVRMFAYPDCVVSSAVIYSEWPEFHELQFIRRQLRRGDMVVDVGANVGHVLLLLADIVGADNTVAFEPTPVSFARLKENWGLNGWDCGRLHQCAVGAEPGVLQIPDTASPVTTNSLKSANGAVNTVPVAVKPLDVMSEWLGDGPVGLLKIDVEGFEPHVFRGALNFLKTRRPRLIMFESLEEKLDLAIATTLTEAGFRVFQLDEAGKPDFTRAAAQNLFAVPGERAASMM